MVRSNHVLAGLVVATGLLLAGCDFTKTDKTRFFSPDKVVAAPQRSPINPILPSLSPVDEAQELVPNSAFPTEEDWTYTDKDYVIGPTDVLDISVLDLLQDGLETVLRREVTASGFVELPLLPESYGGRIRAEGLTSEQLKAKIAEAYSPSVLRDPTISVTISARRQNTFSILGAIARPGTYNVARRDMRLLEALAVAGGITQTNIRYIYVIRPSPAIRLSQAASQPSAAAPATPSPATTPSNVMTVVPQPDEPAAVPSPTTTAASAPADAGMPVPQSQPVPNVTDVDAALRELGGVMAQPEVVPESSTQPAPVVLPRLTQIADGPAAEPAKNPQVDELVKPSDTYKWVFSNGRWVRVAQKEPAQPQPSEPVASPAPATSPVTSPALAGEEACAKGDDPFGWKRMGQADMARIIAINLPKLQAGDPRMNVVVRDNDIVMAPTLEVGEFYVMGEVLRPGVYSLTGRRVTVKMALAAAGNLAPLAWPDNSILIRRIGEDQEQVIPIRIEKIFRGEEPDVFLKANDVIAVGTDVRATFYAVLRNAFRMTYGFGFIYDRNFAQGIGSGVNSERFTRF